jgi:hypothetical protein
LLIFVRTHLLLINLRLLNLLRADDLEAVRLFLVACHLLGGLGLLLILFLLDDGLFVGGFVVLSQA